MAERGAREATEQVHHPQAPGVDRVVRLEQPDRWNQAVLLAVAPSVGADELEAALRTATRDAEAARTEAERASAART